MEESRRPIILEPPENAETWDRNRGDTSFEIDGSALRNRFREFFRNFRNGNVYVYRDALVRHWNRSEFFIEIDLSHLNEYDEILFNNLQVKKTKIKCFYFHSSYIIYN
jgi:hypothetical protein